MKQSKIKIPTVKIEKENVIYIITTLNGAVIIQNDGDKDFNNTILSYVFDEGYDESDLSGLVKMLYELIGMLGVVWNKTDKEQIEIKIVHGTNYECKEKKCKICKPDISMGKVRK